MMLQLRGSRSTEGHHQGRQLEPFRAMAPKKVIKVAMKKKLKLKSTAKNAQKSANIGPPTSIMKNPAAAPPQGGPLKGILKKKPPKKTADSDDEPPLSKTDAAGKVDMSFLKNHAERAKAFGRLNTAIKNYTGAGKADLLAMRNQYTRQGAPDRHKKARALLEDWIIDPSFGRAIARYKIEVSSAEELRSDDEIVSKGRLEMLEGKQEAKDLIEKNVLPETTDKYGRVAYVYSTQRAARISRKQHTFQQDTSMNLNAKQANKVAEGLMDTEIESLGAQGTNHRSKAPPPPKELSEEEKKAKEKEALVRKLWLKGAKCLEKGPQCRTFTQEVKAPDCQRLEYQHQFKAEGGTALERPVENSLGYKSKFAPWDRPHSEKSHAGV